MRSTWSELSVRHTREVTFAFEVAPDGTLKGRAHVHMASEPVVFGPCTWLNQVSPDDFVVEVTGRRTGDEFEIGLGTVAGSTLSHTVWGPCASPSPSTVTTAIGTNPLYLGGIPLALQGPNTVVFRVGAQAEATNSQTFPLPAGGTYTYQIDIHPARATSRPLPLRGSLLTQPVSGATRCRRSRPFST
jgi:hypothetical protein